MFEHAAGDRTHAHNAPRDAYDRRIVRDRMNDYRTGADFHIVANLDTAEYFRTGSDYDVVADRGMALAVFIACASERHALVKQDIVADFGGLTDDHTHTVIDEKPAADLRAGMNFN